MTLEWEQAARWKTLHQRSCRWLDDVSAALGPEAEGAVGIALLSRSRWGVTSGKRRQYPGRDNTLIRSIRSGSKMSTGN